MKRVFFILAIFILLSSTNLFVTEGTIAVELLVKRQANYIHSDPVENEAGVYQRGDIVVTMPDGHPWGIEEHPLTTTYNPPKFFIVKIPGIAIAQASKYLKSRMDDIDTSRVKTRRLWKLRADDIPQWVKGSIQTTGEVTVIWNQIRTFIKNKKTGATE